MGGRAGRGVDGGWQQRWRRVKALDVSIPALNWAIALRLKPTQKLALLALAHRHHQKTGQCNPAVSTLMADTGLSRSATKTALRDLEALKLVRPVARTAAARDLSNQYDLLFGSPANGENRRSGADRMGGRVPTPWRGPEARGPGADPRGPEADPNKEGKGKKDSSQKERGSEEERYTRGLRVVGADEFVPDDPFGGAA